MEQNLSMATSQEVMPSKFNSLQTSERLPLSSWILSYANPHKERGNGWWVIEMDSAEINSNAMFDPSAKEELGSE